MASGRRTAALLALLAATLVVGLEEQQQEEQREEQQQQEEPQEEQQEEQQGARGCPGRCRCEEDGLLRRLHCSDLGLSEVPQELSVFTSYL
ncbi:unnamed protein product [Merluccius merluccius]